jgi:hypothetical protein
VGMSGLIRSDQAAAFCALHAPGQPVVQAVLRSRSGSKKFYFGSDERGPPFYEIELFEYHSMAVAVEKLEMFFRLLRRFFRNDLDSTSKVSSISISFS